MSAISNGSAGRTLLNALIGMVAGLVSGAISGLATGIVGMVSFHIFLKLTVDDPTPHESLPLLYSIVAGAAIGLGGILIGPIVGIVVGTIINARNSREGIRIVITAAAIGTFAGLLVGVSAPAANLFLTKYGITLFSYLLYHSLLIDILFLTAAGVIIGIGAGVYTGRTGNH